MKKFLVWTGIIFVVVIIGLFAAFKYMQAQTKKNSPEGLAEYASGDLKLSVFYNRPSLRGREIIGSDAIPYGKVWRTGANEASTFTTSKPLLIGGKTLPAGKYTLWTIPNQSTWTVILNKKQYPWGVNMKGEAARETEFDVLTVDVPVETLVQSVEQFTISFETEKGLSLVLSWDHVRIVVPIQEQ
jgi:hypothetical protein